jgi:hypothetical protein
MSTSPETRAKSQETKKTCLPTLRGYIRYDGVTADQFLMHKEFQ